jgi:hypothetical protein
VECGEVTRWALSGPLPHPPCSHRELPQIPQSASIGQGPASPQDSDGLRPHHSGRVAWSGKGRRACDGGACRLARAHGLLRVPESEAGRGSSDKDEPLILNLLLHSGRRGRSDVACRRGPSRVLCQSNQGGDGGLRAPRPCVEERGGASRNWSSRLSLQSSSLPASGVASSPTGGPLLLSERPSLPPLEDSCSSGACRAAEPDPVNAMPSAMPFSAALDPLRGCRPRLWGLVWGVGVSCYSAPPGWLVGWLAGSLVRWFAAPAARRSSLSLAALDRRLSPVDARDRR